MRSPLHSSERGFSFVETLVAAGLLLIITLGILPLFTSSIRSNDTGREYTMVSNGARSRAEELFQLPFNSPTLTITTGTSRTIADYYALDERAWKTGGQAEAYTNGDIAQFLRTAVIRQYSLDNLNDPKPAGTDPESIHIKEIVVTVEGVDPATTFGSKKTATLRLYKAE
jgi:hypothetical protein